MKILNYIRLCVFMTSITIRSPYLFIISLLFLFLKGSEAQSDWGLNYEVYANFKYLTRDAHDLNFQACQILLMTFQQHMLFWTVRSHFFCWRDRQQLFEYITQYKQPIYPSSTPGHHPAAEHINLSHL